MEKEYGLILPGQKKKPVAPVREIKRLAAFDESSDSSESDDANAPQAPLRSKYGTSALGPGATAQRLAERMQKKALEEDPTVFQYDEIYDDIETKREEEKETKAKEPKKPKYISRLLETAERRKLENELRVERQVQKEREAEGEQFKDKESFVTTAYRKKLEEMRKLQEDEERDNYLETIGDVTKQKDLDGFYRHLYEQKMGTTKEVVKPTLSNDAEVKYTPITSGRPPQQPQQPQQQQKQRAYRKRRSSDDDDTEDAKPALETKKVHLPNNIDADSDFSIDSSSSESSDDEDKNSDAAEKDTAKNQDLGLDSSKLALKLDTMKSTENVEKSNEVKTKENHDDKKDKHKEETEKPPPPKKEKIDVWKKRTVGEVFEAALQRYYERKAAKTG